MRGFGSKGMQDIEGVGGRREVLEFVFVRGEQERDKKWQGQAKA